MENSENRGDRDRGPDSPGKASYGRDPAVGQWHLVASCPGPGHVVLSLGSEIQHF